ncbi:MULTISPECIES: 50S ribosomal protein L25/general stress protein Ctc [Corynebacterium]|uniref:50S ribosomal protein L25/general stress protein Ctc n=1 Tax=Corynebacterium TaxID=1716 RepID=UPI000660A5AF|nr:MULTISPECIES: 50S ribosomal protein L25/general stress protein Ctc [Corynebacterium]MBC6761198.1 50S ribosomal protein L25 [Corynebacterium sp. LK27]MDK7110526.1 50S ribosomal protein L25/general stress protein Ctc [Corynebacterium amycolatum]MDK7145536.1 50S ribosomal protein L25/general stress protein Ctc [Corynebacterium amycolatum]MDK7238527.1 50S ribosomal protein L25/general stress protein Ctc [Corynebacterium amycolatum]MDK7248564.1 50S ribosomal protein L25/general stress protein Ct
MAKPNIIKIDARNRTEFGKGAARRARVAGDIPVVIYGADLDAPKHILVDTLDFHAVIRNHGVNAVLDVNIEGESQLSMVKAVDQNPLTLDIDHADLLAIHRDEKVEVEVPVTPTGEVAPGALLTQDAETILVNAPVLAIPEEIEVSVEGAEVGTMIHAGDVTLPEGLVLTDDADLLIFNIVEPEEEPAGDVDADIEGMGEAETPDEPAEESAE